MHSNASRPGKDGHRFVDNISRCISPMKLFYFVSDFAETSKKIRLPTSHLWFRYWLGAHQASRHCMKQRWPYTSWTCLTLTSLGYITLVITGTIIPVLYLKAKSLQLISRSSTSKFHLHVTDFQIADLSLRQGIHSSGEIVMPITWATAKPCHQIHGLHVALLWRHNGHSSVSNYQPHDCLHSRLFRRRSK